MRNLASFKLIAITFALVMALIDVAVFPVLKYIKDGTVSAWWLLLFVGLYSLQPLIFYKALDYSNVAVVNIMWDIMSDILVTIIAIYFLKEDISWPSKVGMIFAMISIYFFSIGNMIDK